MIMNTVTVFDKDVARVCKGSNSVFIVKCGLFVVIVKEEIAPSQSKWVLNTYRAHDTGDAYNKWLHWIGKMCKKELSSKYFANYQTCPSFTNGYTPTDAERAELMVDMQYKIQAVIGEDSTMEKAVINPYALLKNIAGERYDEVAKYMPDCWAELDEDSIYLAAGDYLRSHPAP